MNRIQDPETARVLAAMISGFPQVETLTPTQLRAAFEAGRARTAEIEAVSRVYDQSITGVEAKIPVRIYSPRADTSERLPLVVFSHGGGFVFGDLDGGHDGLCRAFANNVDAVVISVDYRLAPETRAPGAAEDMYTVTAWADASADTLGIDRDRICVAGDSAGGNLAGATALLARDRDGPAIAAQILIYPVISPDFTTESYGEYANGYFNTRAAMQWYWNHYAPTPELRVHPSVNLLSASDFSGLPPTILVGAECDPLYSEGVHYADALTRAGVPTLRRSYPDIFHGFMTIPTLTACVDARTQLWIDVRTALNARTREATPWPDQ